MEQGNCNAQGAIASQVLSNISLFLRTRNDGKKITIRSSCKRAGTGFHLLDVLADSLGEGGSVLRSAIASGRGGRARATIRCDLLAARLASSVVELGRLRHQISRALSRIAECCVTSARRPLPPAGVTRRISDVQRPQNLCRTGRNKHRG